MEFEQHKCGLVIPKEQPPEKTPEEQYAEHRRFFGTLEIRDPERRELAKQAMSLLWDAMHLTYPGTVRIENNGGENLYAAHMAAYRYIGGMILGKDCPDKEYCC